MVYSLPTATRGLASATASARGAHTMRPTGTGAKKLGASVAARTLRLPGIMRKPRWPSPGAVRVMGHHISVNTVFAAYADRGRKIVAIVVAGGLRTVRVYGAASGKLRSCSKPFPRPYWLAAAVDATGGHVAVSGDFRSPLVWSISKGTVRELQVAKRHGSLDDMQIKALCFSRIGTTLFGGMMGQIKAWKLKGGGQQAYGPFGPNRPRSLPHYPASSVGSIIRFRGSYAPNCFWYNALALGHGGRTIMDAADAIVHVRKLPNMHIEYSIHTRVSLPSVAVTRDGGRIAVGGRPLLTVRPRVPPDYSRGRPHWIVREHPGGRLEIWSLRSRRMLVNIRCTTLALRGVDFSPSGNLVSAVGRRLRHHRDAYRTRLGIWNSRTGQLLAWVDPQKHGYIKGACFGPGGATMLVFGSGPPLVWRLPPKLAALSGGKASE